MTQFVTLSIQRHVSAHLSESQASVCFTLRGKQNVCRFPRQQLKPANFTIVLTSSQCHCLGFRIQIEML